MNEEVSYFATEDFASLVNENNANKLNKFLGLVLDDAIENKRTNSETIEDVSKLVNSLKFKY